MKSLARFHAAKPKHDDTMNESKPVIADNVVKSKWIPTRTMLERLFTYNYQTGDLIWMSRPRSDFKDSRSFHAWNAKFTERVAGVKRRRLSGEKANVKITINKQCFVAHRVIFILFGIHVPSGMDIDHINGDAWDNRIDNLRIATRSQNNWNQMKWCDNGLPKGVSFKKGSNGHIRYFARVCVSRKVFYGPRRDTIDEAAQDRNDLAARLHGEFSRES